MLLCGKMKNSGEKDEGENIIAQRHIFYDLDFDMKKGSCTLNVQNPFFICGASRGCIFLIRYLNIHGACSTLKSKNIIYKTTLLPVAADLFAASNISITIML